MRKLSISLTIVSILVVSYFNYQTENQDSQSSDETLKRTNKTNIVRNDTILSSDTSNSINNITNLVEDNQLKNEINISTPQEIYFQYIADASSGDHTAQYRIAMALEDCFWKVQPSLLEIESTLDELSMSGINFTQEEMELKRKSAKDCEQIYIDNPGKNLKILQEAWLTEAASNGSPFAYSELAISEIKAVNTPEFSHAFKLKITESFEQNFNDKNLIDRALFHAHIYRMNLFRPSDDDNGMASIATRSLLIAQCYNMPTYYNNCMNEVESDHEFDNYYYLDPDLVLASELAINLLDNIESGNLNNFDLDNINLFDNQ